MVKTISDVGTGRVQGSQGCNKSFLSFSSGLVVYIILAYSGCYLSTGSSLPSKFMRIKYLTQKAMDT
jgi:hypothetical protein